MRSTLFALPLLALAAALAAAGDPQPGADRAPRGPLDAAEAYAEHCARCHGATGDGKGTAELDRPARSFLDGGYSYGNTENAVKRSIRHGIPGTPMPAFPDFTDVEVAALAKYVIGLGPVGTITAPGASVLTIEDRPMVVHGMMPALAQGGRREPRSVVIGFPNGTTFQYRGPDAELLATFVGDFLDRADWGGRGGAPLKPLGSVAWTQTPAALAASQVIAKDAKPLRRKLVGTSILRPDLVRIDFDMLDDAGKRVAGGHEYVGFLDVEGVPVPVRTLMTSGTGAKFPELEGEPLSNLGGFSLAPVEVYAAGKDTFVGHLPGVPGLRLLIHTRTFSEATGQALLTSLESGDNR